MNVALSFRKILRNIFSVIAREFEVYSEYDLGFTTTSRTR